MVKSFLHVNILDKVNIFYSAMSRSFSFPNVEAMQMPNAVQFDAAPIALESSKSSLTEDEQIISSIRQFFPETWLWNIESVG